MWWAWCIDRKLTDLCGRFWHNTINSKSIDGYVGEKQNATGIDAEMYKAFVQLRVFM